MEPTLFVGMGAVAKGFTEGVTYKPKEFIRLFTDKEPTSCIVEAYIDFVPKLPIGKLELHLLQDTLDNAVVEAACRLLVPGGILRTKLDVSFMNGFSKFVEGVYVKSMHTPRTLIAPKVKGFKGLLFNSYHIELRDFGRNTNSGFTLVRKGELLSLKGASTEVHAWHVSQEGPLDPVLHYKSVLSTLFTSNYRTLNLPITKELESSIASWQKSREIALSSYPNNYNDDQLYYTLQTGDVVLRQSEPFKVLEVKYPSALETPSIILGSESD